MTTPSQDHLKGHTKATRRGQGCGQDRSAGSGRFAASLSEILEERDMSQSELAKSIGTSRAYVSQLMSGKQASPDRINRIAGSISLTDEERVRLHRSAARDQGFDLSLPDDY